MEERLRYLFKQYLENACTYKELNEFLQYVRDARHDETLRQCIKKVYSDLNLSSSGPAHVDEKGRLILTEPEWLGTVVPAVRPRSSARITWLSIAALVILMAGTIWVMPGKTPNAKRTPGLSSLTKKSTDRSESKLLILEDSTQVWLNAASSLEFPDHFDSHKREVFLSGEAFFDVKHADKIPFIIHTGTISTTVLGTAFNIKAYPGQKNITISVSRGKVKVSRGDGWVATLTKGQQVKLKEEKKEVVERTIPATDVAAWQQGNIVYDDESFEDIIADMQRIYNVNIRIADPSMHELRISTSFKKEIGVEQALQVLCKLTDTELKTGEANYLIN